MHWVHKSELSKVVKGVDGRRTVGSWVVGSGQWAENDVAQRT